MVQLSVMQRHSSHHWLNVDDIYRENVAVGSKKHQSCRWPWLVLSWREKSRRSVRQATVVVGP